MPQIPAQRLPEVAPSGPSGAYLRVQADSEAFGGPQGRALQKVGGDLESAGNVTASTALKLQQSYNETAVDQQNTSLDTTVRPMVANFRTLQGSSAMDAREGVNKQIEETRQSMREALKNPEQQRMFDYMSRRTIGRYQDEVEFHAATEFKVWQGETAKGAIDNAITNSSRYMPNDPRFAQSLGEIGGFADQLSRLKGIDPDSDAGKVARAHYQSEALGASIKTVMAQPGGADLARQVFDANKDHLDAAHRASLDVEITNHQYTELARDEALQRRADAGAEKLLRTTQTTNAASLVADAMSGKHVPTAKLADMVRTQQISEAGLNAYLAMIKRDPNAPDTSRAALDAWHKVYSGDYGVDDVYALGQAGHLKATTAKEMMAVASARGGKVDTVAAQQARAAVMAAAGVPDGMLNITHDDAVRKAQALIEWTNRVVTNGEDPIQVRDDMVQKYQPPGRPPLTWPVPKMGQVTSTQELVDVAARTKAEKAAGRITDAEYAAQGQLLKQYQAFFTQADQARAARAQLAKNPGAKPGEKPRVIGAQVSP